MQQKQRTIAQKCMIVLIGTAWVTGLLMAGSDSAYMPWTNGFGLLIFLLSSMLLGKQLGSSKSKTIQMSFPKMNQKPGKAILQHAKSNQRMKIRYAL